MSLETMHEGVLAYMHAKNGWLPLYTNVAAMPVETGSVFEYCLCSDQAAQQSEKLLRIAQTKQADIWKDLR